MLIIKISDGRTSLFQWDRGVKFNILCGSDTVTEMHFVTPNGIIRREVEGNTVNVPDAALQNPGTLTIYAFLRDTSCAITRREIHIEVLARPKPADYIDPPEEEDYIGVIVDRLKVLPEVKGEKGEPGKDATVTEESIESALGYLPVKDIRIKDATIVSDGIAQIPIADDTGTVGVIKGGNVILTGIWFDNGIPKISFATNREIETRSGLRKTIVCENLDYAIKAAMCDGKGAAWTSSEQAGAKTRIGINKPFELIETITINENEIGVIERKNLNLEAAMIVMDAQPEGTKAVGAFVIFTAGTSKEFVGGGASYINKDYEYMSKIIVQKSNGIWDVTSTGAVKGWGGGGTLGQGNPYNVIHATDTENIMKIKLYTTNGYYPVGTIIKIYGVSA